MTSKGFISSTASEQVNNVIPFSLSKSITRQWSANIFLLITFHNAYIKLLVNLQSTNIKLN